MRPLEILRETINAHYDRLTGTDAETMDHQVLLVRDWVKAQPALRAVLAEAEGAEPELDYDTWRENLDGQEFSWSSRSEAGRAWLVWRLMNDIATAAQAGASYRVRNHATRFRGPIGPVGVRDQNNHVVREFAKQVFKPLFDYLSDQVGLGSAVLHVLQRYVARLEWYDRHETYRRYEDAVTAGQVGEEVYNLDLERFLFLDGGYITHAKARSASGEVDLLGGLGTSDPLVCEGKVFSDKCGKSRIVDGFHQVIKYANDYRKNVAYLVVFNLTDRLLKFPTDAPSGAWLPSIEESGVRVHFIAVRARPPATTASKAGKATTVVISREDLVNLGD